MSFYGKLISETAAKSGRVDVDPRHVEAFMRLEHPTLDGLDRRQFDSEVRIAIACIDEGGLIEAEACAESFGL